MDTTAKAAIYSFYSNESFCTKGALQVTNECSWNQMAYGQWATGVITDRPMYNMLQKINQTEYRNEKAHSYTRIYKDVSQLALPDFTPELSYYAMKS